MTPVRTFQQRMKQGNAFTGFLLKLSHKLALKISQLIVFGNPSYTDAIRDDLLPIVIGRVTESINERDYDQMSELMTPYLATIYKHACKNMQSDGYRIHLDIDVQESKSLSDYGLIKMGDPEAFDYTIPYTTRKAKYIVNSSESLAIAFPRNMDGINPSNGQDQGQNQSYSRLWIGFEYGFVVNAKVKVDLYKGTRIVDSDTGTMRIPVSVSSPHYPSVKSVMTALSGNKEDQVDEPFRWRVSDLFHLADQNNASNIAKATMKKNI
ncbi:hypothetical protein EV175_002191 [Coemansia sp. RSA 1933]|nr:hypothetical protein EV175_002191 [Coemansia sp. RSA 1933]